MAESARQAALGLTAGKAIQPTPSPKESAGARTIQLGDMERVTRGSFDFTNKMGQLLREGTGLNFARLEGTRRAYSLAFHDKSDKIDGALSDPAFDALSSVRNVIVHSGGKADSEYVERLREVPGLPALALGQPLLLDGATVRRLVEPVVKQAFVLLKAVDSWLIIP